MKLKLRSKFHQDFTNHGYLHSTAWKALYNFKVTRAQEARDSSFKILKIVRFLRSLKCSETTVELMLTTQKANAYSPWTACSVFDFWVNLAKTENCQFKLKFCS